jgi:hypothetical protein
MDGILEELARARMTERVGEAEGLRPGRRHLRALRLSRRADDAAGRARAALARTR